MKYIFISFLFLFSLADIQAEEKIVGRMYFQPFLGHLHKNPTKASSSLTTIQCAYSVKILQDEEVGVPKGWFYAQVGDDKGFIHSEFLSEKRPTCFQEKYPYFYLNLNLDLSEMYYWGRLSDQYVSEESKTK